MKIEKQDRERERRCLRDFHSVSTDDEQATVDNIFTFFNPTTQINTVTEIFRIAPPRVSSEPNNEI